ncbi:Hypothetical protein NTJ_11615 [Nesidiocoris tenuis]|uniref:Uncharacterized protein n=1 Tax=Nesidiocoris tenuis TaxID=355587 RepID=A0ABN7B3H4_9HEMI|nr:Hypothetical protein NTJ_11615 [Nesidiocoris tenuis]
MDRGSKVTCHYALDGAMEWSSCINFVSATEGQLRDFAILLRSECCALVLTINFISLCCNKSPERISSTKSPIAGTKEHFGALQFKVTRDWSTVVFLTAIWEISLGCAVSIGRYSLPEPCDVVKSTSSIGSIKRLIANYKSVIEMSFPTIGMEFSSKSNRTYTGGASSSGNFENSEKSRVPFEALQFRNVDGRDFEVFPP